jgi:hypothetical protein
MLGSYKERFGWAVSGERFGALNKIEFTLGISRLSMTKCRILSPFLLEEGRSFEDMLSPENFPCRFAPSSLNREFTREEIWTGKH